MKSVLSLTVFLAGQVSGQSLVNFSHLQHLTERIEFGGDSVSIVRVYANYPSYDWVEAKDTGTEGIACVDDAARAAVVYLRHFELTKDAPSLERAGSLLEFVLRMEAEDGTFYNFVYADHTINKTGETSRGSFGWWAARAVWSMGLGYRVMLQSRPEFAHRLEVALTKCFPHIDSLLTKYGQKQNRGKYISPRWLPYEEASDATTELLLGLLEYEQASKDPAVRSYILKLAEGIRIMQDGDVNDYPYGLHRSWRTMWHMWGNGQTQALAQVNLLLKDKKCLASAEREARSFYSRLLIDGFMKEFDVAEPEKSTYFEQIAYGVRPMAVGLIRLYEATGKKEYAAMAGLAASWLFGNNAARQSMYDPSTGRCFDGIRDSTGVNRNSGAESTIEALHTILEVERFPEAQKYLRHTKVRMGSSKRYKFAVFRGSDGEETTLALDLRQHRVLVLQGEKEKRFHLNLK